MFHYRTLANYIVWHIVHGFQFVLPQSFNLAKLKFDSAMYGVHGGTPRWRSCIERLSGTMMYAVGSLFVDEHFSSNDKKKVDPCSVKLNNNVCLH